MSEAPKEKFDAVLSLVANGYTISKAMKMSGSRSLYATMSPEQRRILKEAKVLNCGCSGDRGCGEWGLPARGKGKGSQSRPITDIFGEYLV